MPPNRSKIASVARQIVDQHHGAGAVGAGIEAERRPLPEHPHIAGILGVERAVAVAQAADEGAAGFLAEDIAVRLAPLAARPSRPPWRARARRRRRSGARHRSTSSGGELTVVPRRLWLRRRPEPAGGGAGRRLGRRQSARHWRQAAMLGQKRSGEQQCDDGEPCGANSCECPRLTPCSRAAAKSRLSIASESADPSPKL